MRIRKSLHPVGLLAALSLAAACGGGDGGGEQQAAMDTTQSAATAPAPMMTDTAMGAQPAPGAEVPATTPPAGAAPAATATPASGSGGPTPAQIAEGKQLFSSGVCASCHTPQATGGPLGPNLTAGPWLTITKGPNELAEIHDRIKNGVPQPKEHPAPMPPMGGGSYSDAQLDALAAYVYSISRAKT